MSNAPIRHFRELLPETAISTDAQDFERYGQDWLQIGKAKPSVVLFPSSTAELQRVVRCAYEHNISLVPSGGRTGLSGGATAYNGEAVISFDRMRRITDVNVLDYTIQAEAGVVTEQLHEEALRHGLFFPVDFASKGSSQLGGNAATNAGGIRVIRYGLFRDWVLGLTAVTGTGEVLKVNGKLVKNQTGYDLKNLIIGSEGTLAIVSELILKVTRPPQDTMRVLCGLNDIHDVLTILSTVRSETANLSAFEYFTRTGLEKVMQVHGYREPLEQQFPVYLVVEIEHAVGPERDRMEGLFVSLIERGLIASAVISQSSKQAAELMAYREKISESLSTGHVQHKNDVAVPVLEVPAFTQALEKLLRERYPSFELALFGHIGDGNIHVSVLKPKDMDPNAFRDDCHKVDEDVFKLVQSHGGTISAEHGVGILKRDFLHISRSAAEIEIMRGIKKVFDPKGILNPGKLL